MATSFVTNIKFQNKPEKQLDVFEFDGGYRTDAHETKLDPNQSPDMENVVFHNTTSIKTRNGYVRYNGDAVGISSDQSNTGASAGTLTITSTATYAAQTFVPSGTIACVQIDAYLAMQTAGEEQYIRLEIWSTSAGAPDALLTSISKSQIKLISGDSETLYSFRFNTPITLTTGTTYAIVVKPYVTSSTQTINQVNVHRTGAAYGSGQVYTSTDTGLNWTGAASQDMKFNIYSAGDTEGTGLLRYYSTTGIQQLFVKFGTTLYRGSDETGALTAQTFGSGGSLTEGNFIDHTTFNDTLLLVDGENYIQKYNGSTNANYTTGTISVTNGSPTIAGSGTAWSTTTNAEVGEYIKLPDGKWYKITAIGSATSITIEVNYQGSTLSGQSYTISPWGEIQGKLESSTTPALSVRPTPKFIETHANRLWVLNNNSLRFSALDTSITEECFNDFETTANAGEIIIPTNKGGVGTGLYSLNGVLYIFQRRSIWAVYGTSPVNFELRNITNEIGMINRKTLVEWNDILVFLSDKGVYLFDGSNLKNASENLVNSDIDSWANKTTPAAILWRNSYLISYSPSGEAYNNEALVLDLTKLIWGKFTKIFANLWSAWGQGTDNGEIYFVSSNQSSVYKWDTGTNDDGYEIRTFYSTPSLGFDANVSDKTIKKFYVQQVVQGDYSMTTTMFSDISSGSTTSEINLSTGTDSLWDVAVWDVDTWSDEDSLITTRIAEFQGIAKYFKFQFEEEGLNTGLEILGITVTERQRRLV